MLDAIEGGVDSVEHGNFMDGDCLQALAGSRAVWVPTLVTVTNLIGCGRFQDPVLLRLARLQIRRIQKAFSLGACVALGSDAGAFRVGHGQGLLDEYRQFREIMTGKWTDPCPEEEPEFEESSRFRITENELKNRLESGEEAIRGRFRQPLQKY